MLVNCYDHRFPGRAESKIRMDALEVRCGAALMEFSQEETDQVFEILKSRAEKKHNEKLAAAVAQAREERYNG